MPSLWTDEGASVSGATRSLPQLQILVQNVDSVHGLYYALLHAWLELVPINAFWLRLPSAIAVGVTAMVVYALGSRLKDERTGVMAAVVFALLPRVTWMGAEGRSSALVTLVVALATLLLVRWTTERQMRLLLVYALCMTAGIWLHLYVGLTLVGHGIALLLRPLSWRARALWAAISVAVVALSAPLLLIAVRQGDQIVSARPGLVTLARHLIVSQWFLGETPGPATSGVAEWTWQGASITLAALCWGLIVSGIYRGVVVDTAGVPVLAWALPLAVLPGLLVAVSALAGSSLYHPRYFSYGTVGVALLVAGALGRLTPATRSLILVLIAMLAAPVYISQRIPGAKAGADWEQVVTAVTARAVPGDGVYYSPRPTTRTISIAYPGRLDTLTDITLLRSAAEDGSLAGESKPLTDVLGAGAPQRVWGIWKLSAPDRLADQSAFSAAGYATCGRWAFTLDEVVCLERA